MNRIAVFVDAGYFYASASELLFGTPLRRGELRLANAEFAQYLAQVAETIGGCPLLRIYWYDGTNSGPTAAHLAMAYLDNVKLRLGFVNQSGEQKGVDGLIFSDLTNLSRNRAISDALLLAGDEDLRVGVQQAQEHGIRVHLLGVEPKDPSGNQSAALQREADTRRQLDAAALGQFLFRREYAGASIVEAEVAAVDADVAHNLARMQELANEYAATLDATQRELILALPERTPLPHELDRELLLRASELLGRKLEEAEKRTLRGALRAAVTQQASAGAAS
ncbi:MAG TPA: NYN domain-containing protein [Rhodanobacteraceae bacterium]|nr:NYN domain-containing protein [Rhodanobacteraceae bacterium]